MFFKQFVEPFRLGIAPHCPVPINADRSIIPLAEFSSGRSILSLTRTKRKIELKLHCILRFASGFPADPSVACKSSMSSFHCSQSHSNLRNGSPLACFGTKRHGFESAGRTKQMVDPGDPLPLRPARSAQFADQFQLSLRNVVIYSVREQALRIPSSGLRKKCDDPSFDGGLIA